MKRIMTMFTFPPVKREMVNGVVVEKDPHPAWMPEFHVIELDMVIEVKFRQVSSDFGEIHVIVKEGKDILFGNIPSKVFGVLMRHYVETRMRPDSEIFERNLFLDVVAYGYLQDDPKFLKWFPFEYLYKEKVAQNNNKELLK